MADPAMQHFVRNIENGDVYIYTESLGENPLFEEVWAKSAEEAGKVRAAAALKNMTSPDIDKMTRKQLMAFAWKALDLQLDVSMSRPDMVTAVQEKMGLEKFTSGSYGNEQDRDPESGRMLPSVQPKDDVDPAEPPK